MGCNDNVSYYLLCCTAVYHGISHQGKKIILGYLRSIFGPKTEGCKQKPGAASQFERFTEHFQYCQVRYKEGCGVCKMYRTDINSAQNIGRSN